MDYERDVVSLLEISIICYNRFCPMKSKQIDYDEKCLERQRCVKLNNSILVESLILFIEMRIYCLVFIYTLYVEANLLPWSEVD